MSWLPDLWQNADKVSLNFVDKDGTKQSYVINLSKNLLSNTMNGQIQDFFRYGSIEDKQKFLELHANKIDLTDIFINFWTYLPWWAYRNMPIIKNLLDIKIKKDEGHYEKLLESWKSSLYINGTLNDFFANIDQWIKEEKLDIEKIIALQDEWWYISKASQQLYEYVRPVYIRLLEQWYSHNDCIF